MSDDRPPSRVLLIAAGLFTQLIGTACLILALASLPVVHDLHRGMQSLIASVIAAVAAIVCGTLAWRGRLVPIALAAGVDVGFGIVLPRGGSALASVFRILPADDAALAESIVTGVAIAMFVAAALCLIALPSAVKLRQWARNEIERASMSAADTTPRPHQTLRGFAATRVYPTQIVHIPGGPNDTKKWLIIVGASVTALVLLIVVVNAATGTKPKLGSGSGAGSVGSAGSAISAIKPAVVAPTPDAPVLVRDVDAPSGPPPIDDLVNAFHAALAQPKKVDVGALVDPKAFAFGVDSHDVAEGRDAVVKVIASAIGDGGDVSPRFHQVTQDGDVAWIAEELKVGTKIFVVTAVAGLHGSEWTFSAIHLAFPLPNEAAYRQARDGSLPVPDAIPDAHDESPLASAMRTAFASKPSFVEARSTRPEAVNFGSAPGERIAGGAAIKKLFGNLRAVIHLHDAVKVGMVGEHGGWGAANVDFTDADRDGTQVTQTFRVLAAWIKEDAGWRIVSTQWSNPK
jgi:hypothetical protein